MMLMDRALDEARLPTDVTALLREFFHGDGDVHDQPSVTSSQCTSGHKLQCTKLTCPL